MQFGAEIIAADQRQSAGIGDEEVELARRFALARPAAVGRRKLLAPQRQPNAGVAESKRNIVAVASHDHAFVYVAGADRAIAHVLPLLSREA
ncbi:MAG TPA: hypothetical protein VNV18_16840 [Stellaceae bacterium]|nr:hypothetical protein [Stellaceae bacterium]